MASPHIHLTPCCELSGLPAAPTHPRATALPFSVVYILNISKYTGYIFGKYSGQQWSQHIQNVTWLNRGANLHFLTLSLYFSSSPMLPATTPTCVKWCSLTWSLSCGPSSGASSCASAPSSTSPLPRGHLPGLPHPRMGGCRVRWRYGCRNGDDGGHWRVDHRWTHKETSFGLEQITEGLQCQQEDDKDCSFSVSVQDSALKCWAFLLHSACRKVFTLSFLPSLSLGDEQHCDQHSLLTVVIHHPPDSHLKL